MIEQARPSAAPIGALTEIDVGFSVILSEHDGEEVMVGPCYCRSVGVSSAKGEHFACHRVVTIVAHLDDAGLLAAVEAGACGILRRAEALPERVAEAVHDTPQEMAQCRPTCSAACWLRWDACTTGSSSATGPTP